MPERDFDVCVVGGCGRVGLPLAIAFARTGYRVVIFDINPDSVASVNESVMPFAEPQGPELLAEVRASGALTATTEASVVAQADAVVIVVGTPVDEYLNPDPHTVSRAVSDLAEHLRPGQLLVLRSTVYPGVTRLVEDAVARLELGVDVAFCPERIAEGHAFTELCSLPQIVAARSEPVAKRASELFRRLTDEIVLVSPEEAELAKLFTNTWRYIKFAAANQLYMIANEHGLDFERIRHAITHEYPRAADMPGPGFAAGPCLFKDTMQLAAFNNNNFTLGHASMTINEGLPLYVVDRMERRFDLANMSVGILGMAFKSESDDIRSSLAYKLRRILRFKAREVLCTDPYVTVDPDLVELETVLERADVLVVAAPHEQYRHLDPSQEMIDVWNLLGRGVVV